ncbi:DUF4880 domain-containing protein [Alcanivorax profundi]|uniref:DUF4880 domain-containing protein n=1 Tax=Alcanivorax profundi TaxID=2338368 RepID=A0A418Y1I9_9GAMM|nr:FecR domain-containing protein [Alcanivorax profundi]RJG19381.1 DUF4880 domain-containing protein [Alcanivorax profundi]
MPSRDLPPYPVLQQAAEWFAQLADHNVTPEEQREWQTWFDQDPQHQQAWLYVEQVGHRFFQAKQQAGGEGANRILEQTRNRRISRRKVLGSGLAGVGAWFTWRYTPIPEATRQLALSLGADYSTATGEQRQISLLDGGQLWLNTASAVDVIYNDQLRNIQLQRGEILIETGTDSHNRPFVVTTQEGRLRALGTRFSVYQGDGQTQIAVYQGAVEIRTAGGPGLVLKAGEKTTFTRHHIDPPGKANTAQVAWQHGLIIADAIPLQTLVTELGRYRHGYLAVDPTIANLNVIGTYPIDKPDHALAMLESALPIQVTRHLPWWVTLQPKP